MIEDVFEGLWKHNIIILCNILVNENSMSSSMDINCHIFLNNIIYTDF